MVFEALPDLNGFPLWSLLLLVFGIAFLYSSVGFGGASGYLAAMSLFALSPQFMAGTSLTLNILVASIAFITYRQAGYFRASLLLPFLVTSVPAAFLGGYVPISDDLYFIILCAALGFIGIRLLIDGRTVKRADAGAEHTAHGNTIPDTDAHAETRPPLLPVLVSGLIIGTISGMVGLGGGIFLSPLVVLAGWGSPKEAAATSAGFIVINSASGLLGRVIGGNFVFGVLGALLLPVGIVGALLGSRLGAQHLSGVYSRRVLGLILILAVARFAVGYF